MIQTRIFNKFLAALLLIFLAVSIAVPGWAANDFSGDPTVKAVWNFDNGALTTDSQGSNTLTNNNAITADLGDFKQGDASASLIEAVSQYFSIPDANLDSGFPLKSSETNRVFSIVGWFKFDLLNDANFHALVMKWDDSSAGRSLFLVNSTNPLSDQIRFGIGHNSGASSEFKDHASTLVTGRWYHIAITHDASRNFRIRIWDDTAGSIVGSDLTGNFTNTISIETTPLLIGAHDSAGVAQFFDGRVDEIVVFDRAISVSEIDEIRSGTFITTTFTPRVIFY